MIVYEIICVKYFLFFKIKTVVKNVVGHGIPTDFHNNSLLLINFKDGHREFINMDKYDNVVFPAVAFLNQQQSNSNSAPPPKRDLTNGDKELMKDL
jgi:hypothetical protein